MRPWSRWATGIDLDKIIADEDGYVGAFSAILSVSVRRFGPRYSSTKA